jgi:hypothetical protein
MIYRTSYGEFGHCLNCFHDFDPDELWQQNIESCPDCGEPLYTADNPEHYIPEDIDFMDKKHFEYFLQSQAKLRKQNRQEYA